MIRKSTSPRRSSLRFSLRASKSGIRSALVIISICLVCSLRAYAQPAGIDSLYSVTATDIVDVLPAPEYTTPDSIAEEGTPLFPLWRLPRVFTGMQRSYPDSVTDYSALPQWLGRSMAQRRHDSEMIYRFMVENPQYIEYAEWLLPIPPEIKADDSSFSRFVGKNNIVNVVGEAPDSASLIKGRRNWIHRFDATMHFSQAYLSPNWYQGGNSSMALLGSVYWDVMLNPAWHPNLIFENTISYKLGFNRIPDDPFGRKYTISEDLFQWNIRGGIKAWKKWYYSVNAQFKTQMLNNYSKDTNVRVASFMSPADLNVGLGMTYQTTNKSETLMFSASIAPISYNLKTCIDSQIDPVQFSIPVGKKTHSEIGSNAEVKLQWQIRSNISWQSRLFLFTNYNNFQGDFENVFSFNINKFLSTQITVHARYDTTVDARAISGNSHGWKYWMLKEILSFGLAYSFATQ